MVTVEETLEAVALERMEIALQYIKTPTWKKKRKRTDSEICGRMVRIATINKQVVLQAHLTLGVINLNDRVPSEILLTMFTISRNRKKISRHRD